MKLRRSEDQQFFEAAEVAIAREEIRKAVERLDQVLDKMEHHLMEGRHASDE
jgi:hypothetical protein